MEKRIGVFDSGLGGLTVVKEIKRLMPNESIIYFGDTARVPYGTKSKETIIKFSSQIVEFLIEKNVKYILIACNTSSALALENLKRKYRVPVMGVIAPGAVAALKVTKTFKIGVIGTPATIKSNAYEKEIKKNNSKINVYSKSTTLLVPIIEENNVPDSILELVIDMYLKDLVKKKIDTLILGCTHYPIIKVQIKKIIGKNINIIDSAKETANMLNEELINNNIKALKKSKLSDLFYVTDSPEKFKLSGEKFLESEIKNIKHINIDFK